MYSLEVDDKCAKELKGYTERNRGLQEQITKKVEQILEQPLHYKPLRGKGFGLRRVHIGSFVLLFAVDETEKVVRLVRFGSHDEAYQF